MNIPIIIFRAALTVALLFSSASHAEKLNARSSEFDQRYIWIVRNALTHKDSIDKFIAFAAENRFNNILVQVRGRGDAYYNSDLIPKSNLIPDKNFDPLAYLIPKARKKGIKVHAWVNVYLLWSSNAKPLQKDHILYSNPEWIDQKSTRTLNINREMRNFNNGKNGNEGFYLAPHHPQVNKYLLKVFKDLVSRYDLNGLHFDYVRFHDSEFGNNPIAISTYERIYGAESFPDPSPAGRAKNKAVSYLGKWNDYRRSAITDLVRETKNMLLDVSPDCELSAAVKPNIYQARERFFQEWDVWLAAGYIDKAIIMNYSADLKDFAANIDVIYDNLPAKYRRNIVIGISTYNQSSGSAVDKIKYSKVTRFKGISIFSYNDLNKNPLYFKQLKKALYP
ncbi:MAG: family 10 glycosylhydrolase [Candidatus Neomarinimicrobiota bacterium]